MRETFAAGVACVVALLAWPTLAVAQRLGSTGEGGCMIARDARVYCWGSNSSGVLGVPGAPARPTAAAVPGVEGATQLSVASDHACALRGDGTVWCWGVNNFGQLGAGTIPRHAYPVHAVAPAAVPGLTDVVQVAASDTVTCARLRDSTVRCFGSNRALGAGAPTGGRLAPTAPRGLPPVASIYPGAIGMFAVAADGASFAWGMSEYGQASTGPAPQVTTPTRVAGLTGVVAVDYTAGNVCVVHGDGGVSCWGNNEFNVLGPGRNARCTITGMANTPETVPCRRTPQRIAGVTDAVDVAVQGTAIVVRRRDGTLLSWGSNSDGSLLDAAAAARPTPAPVAGVTGVDEIASEGGGGLCVRSGERVQCWNTQARRFDAIQGLP